MEKLISISDLSKLLNLTNSKNKKPLNHIIRYWEKEFKQIRPIMHNKRRYYSKKHIELIKLIKFLLKDKGMTISGVKKILKSNVNTLDVYNSNSLKTEYLKENVKTRSKKLLEKIRKIKNYGQKNTY